MVEFVKPYVKCDADFRSLCSQGFAKAFYCCTMVLINEVEY